MVMALISNLLYKKNRSLKNAERKRYNRLFCSPKLLNGNKVMLKNGNTSIVGVLETYHAHFWTGDCLEGT